MEAISIASLVERLMNISTEAIALADAVKAATDNKGQKNDPEKFPPFPECIEESTKAAPETSTPACSKEDVRKVLAELATSGHRAEVKQMLKKHGANCLSDLDAKPDEFAALMAEAKEFSNA